MTIIIKFGFYFLFQAHQYLILISEVEETEIFKICLEYWNTLASELYRESPFSSTPSSPLLLGGTTPDIPPRRQMYLLILSKVRVEIASTTFRIYIFYYHFFSHAYFIAS